MPTLENIQDEIANVLNCDLSSLDDEQQRIFDEYLSGLATAEANKVEAYLVLEDHTNAEIEWNKQQAAIYAAKADQLRKSMEWRRNYILATMQQHGLTSIKGRTGSISRAPSPVRLLVGRELPDAWKTEQVTVVALPDMDRIKAALEAGEDVPGVVVQAGEHIRFNRARSK